MQSCSSESRCSSESNESSQVVLLSPRLLPEQIQHGKTQKRKQQKREESNSVGRRNLQEMPE